MRVLFIGNSFTRFWGGQVLIGEQIALSSPAGQARPPIYEQSTYNGWDLQEHWTRGKAVQRIREGNWDYVVLQEHSEGPLLQRDAFVHYAKEFDAEIRRVGARTVLFMTWAKVGEPELQREVADAYEALGAELNAPVVPVGWAFADALARRPELRLHDGDGKHPSPAGSYLTACCFYRFLYGQSPRGLRRTIYDHATEWLVVSEADALFLQDVADRVVGAKERPAK
jgi:hypothetical protein